MADRGRRSLREREIIMSKAMPVVKNFGDLHTTEDGQLIVKQRGNDDSMDTCRSAIEDEDGDSDMETIRILQEQYEKESKKANIPVPPIVTIDDYDRFVAKDFTRPVQYQKHKIWSDKELDELLEYEMDDEDLDWLSNKLPELKVQIKEDKFEQIIDRLEKESQKQGKMCDQSALESYKLGGGKQVTAVYEYWSRKRSKLGKPLIRRMQPPTPLSDPSPHNTFRPREKEEKKSRRTRKNDKDAHKKLKALQADLKRAKEILERVHWREKIKKAILKVEFCLQFAKDIKDIPPSVISENDQFCKEVAREKAKREAAKKRDLGIDTEQQRPRAVPRPQMPTSVGMPVDGVAVAEEQPAVSEERAEAIRRCFQHLMSDWDEDRECAGTSALPVTSDGKMCSENSCNSGEKLPFRGRARLGRGGRVVYDRCSAAVSGMHGAFTESGGVYDAGSNRGDGMDEYMVDRPGDRAWAMLKSMRTWDRDHNAGNGSKDSRRCDWNYLGGKAEDSAG
eukprot:CAMPEP_0173086122 /NCGR_PEP_ID=MMETSP1102-20130122/22454_1 /TAXON_ID=49646 /ORGANISM="Geminigera sp., Strain Caron Lab Isolate" /LENGTH=506 /DNA_ID=CAMNT_0013966381 /DNA_START=561 /DNA_END=2077 /DNA_ORIENTATION=+